MLPFLGAGAGQGIEDAYLLAELLSNPQTTTKNVEVRAARSFWSCTLTHHLATGGPAGVL